MYDFKELVAELLKQGLTIKQLPKAIVQLTLCLKYDWCVNDRDFLATLREAKASLLNLDNCESITGEYRGLVKKYIEKDRELLNKIGIGEALISMTCIDMDIVDEIHGYIMTWNVEEFVAEHVHEDESSLFSGIVHKYGLTKVDSDKIEDGVETYLVNYQTNECYILKHYGVKNIHTGSVRYEAHLYKAIPTTESIEDGKHKEMVYMTDKTSDFSRGRASMRDTVIALIIGMQNANGNKVESEEYKAYQKILEKIESEYGEFMHEIKG